MVSIRCKIVVKETLQRLGLGYLSVDLGEVELVEPLTPQQTAQLGEELKQSGLVLMDDKRSILIENIKRVIIGMIHYADELPAMKNSDYISAQLNHNYTYLANIFSEVTGITIEQYIIMHKVERIKELLLYDELNITEISYRLNYSSVAHLSNQFKKITGLTPSYFKKMGRKRRNPLEDI